MTEEQQQEIWSGVHPNRKMPGTFEQKDGCCNSRLRNKDLNELGITRYCSKSAGYGTQHPGEGTCKHHLGNSPTHVRSAAREIVKRELLTLSEQLGEAPPMGPPELEIFELARKVKQWSLIIEHRMDELGVLVITDQAGIEHTRALIELMERAWDRQQRVLEFLLKHGLDKKAIALEERQIELIQKVFFDLIMDTEINLSELQVRLMRRKFAEGIVALGSSLTPSWAQGVVDDSDIIDAEIVED